MFDPNLMDSTRYSALLHEFGNRKVLPSGYERQALIVLSFYPELKNININIKFETDRRTIEHGLGFQLLAWNEYGFGFFDAGSDTTPSTIKKMLEAERYMRPETIKEIMASLPEYHTYNRGLDQ